MRNVLVEDFCGNIMGVAKVGDFGPEAAARMVGSVLGFTGAMKTVAESVAYTTGDTVS